MFRAVVLSRSVAQTCARRHVASSAVLAQKATASDPIQKLFLDKIKDYGTKSQSAEGGLVDCGADARRALQDELDKISKVFGAAGPDFMNFPTFSFTDPALEAPGVEGKAKEAVGVTAAEDESVADAEDKPYWEA